MKIDELLVRVTERVSNGYTDLRAVFGSVPPPGISVVAGRLRLWFWIVDLGYCPMLHGGLALIRPADDVTRIFL